MRTEEANEVLRGLKSSVKNISSKFFYDEVGSELFNQITEQEEYYLTSCEKEILLTHGSLISGRIPYDSVALVDLGSGDGSKAVLLLQSILRTGKKAEYVVIEISPKALNETVERISKECPSVSIQSHEADFSWALGNLPNLSRQHKLVAFFGSSIGNFEPEQARTFFKNLSEQLQPGDFALVGFDLKKDQNVLHAAYNDRKGLTAQFNLNLLERFNKELGADFDLSGFRHFEQYNAQIGAMESYLISARDQVVHLKKLNATIRFSKGEPVHTEYSFKYNESDIQDLVAGTSLSIEDFFYDRKRYFLSALFKKTTGLL